MNLFHFSLLHGPSRQNESVGRTKRGEKKKRISLEKPRYRCVFRLPIVYLNLTLLIRQCKLDNGSRRFSIRSLSPALDILSEY